MSLAGAAPFDLTQAELTAFATGVSGPIVIGDAAASTGTLTIGGTANLAGETLTLNAGSITDGANPGRTVTAANLNLNARTGAIGSAAANGAIDVAVTNLTVTTSGQNAYVNATGAVNLGAGASNLGAGGLNLTATGAITQSGAVTATGSSTFAANNITLSNAANDFGTVAVTSGSAVSLVDANALALGASSATSLRAQTLGGDLTLNGAVTATGGGNSIVLASAANFVNNVGAGALIVPVGGRWVVYSANPAGNTFNGLASGNQAVWGASFAGLPPTSPSMPGGNRYVFSTQPTVTLTSTDAAKVYGDLADVSTNYTATGFVDAAASGNVFTQDTVANSFAPFSVTSAGTPMSANAGVYPIVIAATPTTGYAVTLSNVGQLTVNGRPITVQANDQARTYGDPNPTTGAYTITAGSLAGADSITNVNVTSPATVLSGVGPYALTPTAANFGAGAATNYTITFADGVLTVTPLPITVTANNQAKVYGQPDPALTFTAPTVNGDVLAGTPARAAGETVAGSPYAITQGTVTNTNNPNYSITFVNGQLVITAANLTITADNKSRPYGDANPPLTATFTGLANGDTAAAIPGVTLTTPAVPASNVGNYTINVGERRERELHDHLRERPARDHARAAADRRRRQGEGVRRAEPAVHRHRDRIQARPDGDGPQWDARLRDAGDDDLAAGRVHDHAGRRLLGELHDHVRRRRAGGRAGRAAVRSGTRDRGQPQRERPDRRPAGRQIDRVSDGRAAGRPPRPRPLLLAQRVPLLDRAIEPRLGVRHRELVVVLPRPVHVGEP